MQKKTALTYQAQVKAITWLGVFCNVALAALKLCLGNACKSQALVADGVHSFSDLVTDAAVLFGASFWSEPADEQHPYGHSKLEALVTFFIGGLLAVVALHMLWGSVEAFFRPSLQFSWALVVVAALSVISKEILFWLTYKKGRSLGSPAVIANAWHHRSDALSSLPVLAVLLIGRIRPDWHWLDGLGGLLVSLLILYAAYEIIRPAFDALLDRGLEEGKLEEIRKEALAVSGVLAVHALRSRVNGSTVFLDMHILVDKDISVYNGHQMSHEVHDRLIEKFGLTDVLVHVEPYTEEEKEEGR